MGLTKSSVGGGAVDSGLNIKKQSPLDKVVALAGNPNVGKSTVFNSLTGLNQHTGNWPGKTVANAKGYCKSAGHSYILVDIPGTYSLMAHSADAVLVVCDATCLERNLNLVLQILEITPDTAVCVNLMDEAKRKNIKINLKLLSERLGVPVTGITARRKKSTAKLLDTLDGLIGSHNASPFKVRYPEEIEKAVAEVEPALRHVDRNHRARRDRTGMAFVFGIRNGFETLHVDRGEYLPEGDRSLFAFDGLHLADVVLILDPDLRADRDLFRDGGFGWRFDCLCSGCRSAAFGTALTPAFNACHLLLDTCRTFSLDLLILFGAFAQLLQRLPG